MSFEQNDYVLYNNKELCQVLTYMPPDSGFPAYAVVKHYSSGLVMAYYVNYLRLLDEEELTWFMLNLPQ